MTYFHVGRTRFQQLVVDVSKEYELAPRHVLSVHDNDTYEARKEIAYKAKKQLHIDNTVLARLMHTSDISIHRMLKDGFYG